MRGAEVLTFREEAVEDNMGNAAAPGAPVVLNGCAVYARGRTDEASGREVTIIEGWTALIPPQDGVDELTATCEVEWTSQFPGRWVKVEGRPFPWKDLQGALCGVQVNLEGADA